MRKWSCFSRLGLRPYKPAPARSAGRAIFRQLFERAPAKSSRSSPKRPLNVLKGKKDVLSFFFTNLVAINSYINLELPCMHCIDLYPVHDDDKAGATQSSLLH